MADEPKPKRQSLEDILQPGGKSPPRKSEPPKGGSEAAPPRDGRGKAGGKDDHAKAGGKDSPKRLIIAGLITGGLSVPGALIPIIGLVLGVAAIVLGVVARRTAGRDRRVLAAIALGGLGVLLSLVVVATSSGGSGGDADKIGSCLADADLASVKSREVSKAKDIGEIKKAADDAKAFVSAEDSGGRDVYVLLFDSKKAAKRARDDVSSDRNVKLRGDNLLIYSKEIGREDRTAIEACFLDEGG